MRKLSALGSALLVAGLLSTGAAGAENLVLLSTQLRPIEEAQKMRNVILKDFPGKVDYVTEQPAQLPARIKAEQQGGTISAVSIGTFGKLPQVGDCFVCL
jgi:multiple sugar transport system substrate-binding protein